MDSSRSVNPNISIIICSFNPEEKIFSRLLKAVAALKVADGVNIECIIVDNNSNPAVNELPCVDLFLKKCHFARIIKESKQGLSFARIAGTKATKSDIIIFFDDDNEPNSDYLLITEKLFANYPLVAAWGPGNISVEYMERVSDWFKKTFNSRFQEIDSNYVEFVSVVEQYNRVFPFGTGLVIRRPIMEKYIEKIESGLLSASDRKGSNLNSYGDNQIFWEAIKMGFSVGRSPELKMRHIISSKKSNLDYLAHLVFDVQLSGPKAFLESFSSEKDKYYKNYPTNKKILYSISKIILFDILRLRLNLLRFHLADYIGTTIGISRSLGLQEKEWLSSLARLLKLF